jgi:hypothetical protein
MKLLKIIKLEDCFDGSIIFEYFFSENIAEEFMRDIGSTGELLYYPNFSKPFYKIFTNDDIQIKGIIGEKSFQIIFPSTNKTILQENFNLFLKNIISK